MPSSTPSRKRLPKQNKNTGVSLQLPRKLVEPLGELLQEMAATKRKEREEKEKKPKSKWSAFWGWWKDYGASAATIVTIISAVVGGLWTLNQYIIQEREKLVQQEHQATLERQALIAQYANDLSDPNKRNTASYAFALVGGEEAIPLLTSELVTTAKYDGDKTYQDALIRALMQVGDPALLPVLNVNRQAYLKNDEQNKRVIIATQPFLYDYFINKRDVLAGKANIFNGIQINGLNLYYGNFEGVDFSGSTFILTNLCLGQFSGGNFENLDFIDSEIGGADFTGSNIKWITIDDETRATGTHFDNSSISGDFQGTYLPQTTWKKSEITKSYLEVALLDYANFDGAVISDTYFTYSRMFGAIFRNSQLESISFSGTDLENADFSGARFDKLEHPFFTDEDQLPNLIATTRDDGIYGTGNAFVRGANFEGATGVNDATRIYLCTWGAINVPGGCAGIKVRVDDMKIVPSTRPAAYDWCF